MGFVGLGVVLSSVDIPRRQRPARDDQARRSDVEVRLREARVSGRRNVCGPLALTSPPLSP